MNARQKLHLVHLQEWTGRLSYSQNRSASWTSGSLGVDLNLLFLISMARYPCSILSTKPSTWIRSLQKNLKSLK